MLYSMHYSKLKQEQCDSCCPLRTILHFFNLKKREQLNRVISAFRVPNSNVPYGFTSLTLGEDYFGADDYTWNFHSSTLNENEENQEDARKVDLIFKCKGYHMKHSLPISADQAMQMLMEEYLRDDTRSSLLNVWAVPKNIPSNVKINVEDVKLEYNPKEALQKLLPSIGHQKLKSIQFLVTKKTLDMFNEPLVKDCEKLILQFPYYDAVPLDALLQLPNSHIHCFHINFPISQLQNLANKWLHTSRSIGDTFTLGIEHYTFVLDVMDHFITKIGATPSRIISLGSSFYSHSVSVPIDDTKELVVTGGSLKMKWPPFKWVFKMEIMKKEATMKK